MSRDKIIVVAGATGLQGGATARRLAADGWRVRALTRDPQKAQTLTKNGIEGVIASFDDRASLDRALQGAHGVFIMATPFGKGANVETEAVHGKTLVDAAKAAGVAHVVYSSVGGADRKSGVPHFESKWKVEEHIRAAGVPATILRPAVFIDMLANAPLAMRMMFYGMLTAELGAGKELQVIAVDDIAHFTAVALDRPQEFLGQAIELAGDSATIPQMASTFRRVTGRRFGGLPLPRALVRRMPEEMSRMMKWFADDGFHADIPALRAIHPGLMTFESAVKRVRNLAEQ